METLLNHPLHDGDWVKGKTENDELFQGYIEAIDTRHGLIHVRVIQSDNAKAVGKLSSSTADRIRRVEDAPLDQEGYLRNLIDIALTTRDEKWFMELTGLLKRLHRGTDTSDAA